MTGIRARVVKGRLVVDEPTDLAEGTVLDLVVDDEGDDLSDNERAVLHDAIAQAQTSMTAGQGRPMREVLADLLRR
jgi:hypothetical protein